MLSDVSLDANKRSFEQKQRSRAGCWNCRSKTVKKRCDQERPSCGRCTRLELECDYTPRPTLAERRRIDKLSRLTQDERNPTKDGSFSSGASDHSTSPPLSIMTLACPPSSPSSVDLLVRDHEAIQYFRHIFPKSHHVKNTDYSLIALMFQVAREEPMVMHMVIAISLQEMNSRRFLPEVMGARESIQHYSSAIRMMADAVSPNIGMKDLDTMCTTLWLMLLYEQQFGDPQYTAYVQHLKGLSSLLQFQFNRALKSGQKGSGDLKESVALLRHSKSRDPTILSAYSARILIWTSLLDSAAASAGIGGQVNETILSSLLPESPSAPGSCSESIGAFAQLRQYSAPLYRLAWGSDYPEAELFDDLENRDAYVFLTECIQLRYTIAQLARLMEDDPIAAVRKVSDVRAAICEVRATFAELIEMAGGLTIERNNDSQLVANVRTIVPIYYAVVLDFLRLTAFDKPLGGQQRHAIKEIVNLAYQTQMHSEDEAMIKIAWPLFIVALETDDMVHHEWVLERFQLLSKYGKNFQRAHQFLLEVIPMQHYRGSRVDVRAHMQRTALFVLG